MEQSQAIRSGFRQCSEDQNANLVELVRAATLAASSHNTQPWLFRAEPNRVDILADWSRRCPRVDPDDHHLYVSLGCAAENLLLAAVARGLQGHISHSVGDSVVRVDFERTRPERRPEFEAIPLRQCSRTAYEGVSLTTSQLRSLEAAARGNGVAARVMTEDEDKEAIIEYVAAGNTAQFADAGWAEEMRKWIRFNAREARRTGDGLYGKVLGIPDVPGWLGRLLMPVATSATRQNQKDAQHIRSSGAIVVLVSEQDDTRHWVEAGRCCERLMLRATTLGLKTAFINQPVEVPRLRAELASFLGLGNGRPDPIVRVGKGPDAPRSLRRPVEEMISGEAEILSETRQQSAADGATPRRRTFHEAES